MGYTKKPLKKLSVNFYEDDIIAIHALSETEDEGRITNYIRKVVHEHVKNATTV